MKPEWEKVSDTPHVLRLHVLGGWLVRTIAYNERSDPAGYFPTTKIVAGVAITFVPDPFHGWELTEDSPVEAKPA